MQTDPEIGDGAFPRQSPPHPECYGPEGWSANPHQRPISEDAIYSSGNPIAPTRAGAFCSARNVFNAPALPANKMGTSAAFFAASIRPFPNLRRAIAGEGAASPYPAFFNGPLWFRRYARKAGFAVAPVSRATSLPHVVAHEED